MHEALVHPDEFPGARGYFDTASVGLPPRSALAELRRHLERWTAGTLDLPGLDAEVDRARAAYARIVGAPSGDDVAIGSTISGFAGLVAASLRPGDEVLVADGDFTSVRYPFLAQEERGVRVRSVALGAICEAMTPRTTLVAVSAAQSADGPCSTSTRWRQPARRSSSTRRRRPAGWRSARRASPTSRRRPTSGCWRRAGWR